METIEEKYLQLAAIFFWDETAISSGEVPPVEWRRIQPILV